MKNIAIVLLLVGMHACFSEDGVINGMEAHATPPTLAKIGDKYGIEKLFDGNLETWWASRPNPQLPQCISLKWTNQQIIKKVSVAFYSGTTNLYMVPTVVEVEFSDGTMLSVDKSTTNNSTTIFDFIVPAEKRCDSVCVRINAVCESKTFIGIREIIMNEKGSSVIMRIYSVDTETINNRRKGNVLL